MEEKESRLRAQPAGHGTADGRTAFPSSIALAVSNDKPPPEVLHQLARMLQGAPPEIAFMAAVQEPWADLVRAVATANGESRLQALETVLRGHPQARTIRADILAIDPLTKPTARAPLEVEYCPTLPNWARLDPNLGEDASPWLDDYIEYAAAISPMTPPLFHASAGLWLPSTAIARRLVLHMPFGDVFPNIYVVWLAATTIYRKTTGLQPARTISRRLFPHLLACQDTTPEAFLSDLSGREPSNLATLPLVDQERWAAERNFAAQRGWILDEMSGLLAQAGRDYNAGLMEALLRLFDCDPMYARSTRTQGRVVVRNAYLTLLGASTPAAMSEHFLVQRLWSNGFWPRHAILTPATERPEWREATESAEPPGLAAGLYELYSRLPKANWPDPPTALSVQMADGVMDCWRQYNRALSHELLTPELDERLWGTYGRLPTQLLKVATIFSALDWGDTRTPIIELKHLARAMTIVEEWRASVHRAIIQVSRSAADGIRRRILKQLAKAVDEGLTKRDLHRYMSDVEPDALQGALDQLVNMGDVEASDIKPESKGRPSTKYRLVKD